MQFLEKYKEIVDQSNPTIDESKTDLISAFKYYKIEGGLSEYLIDEYLSNLINEALTSGELEVNKVKRAKDHLLLDYFLNGIPLKSYLHTLEIIDRVTNLNNLITSLKDQKRWKKAISASLDHNLVIGRHEKLRQKYSRHYNVTKSAEFFQKEGYDIVLRNGEFFVPISGLMKIYQDIETMMKLIGGKKFTEMLFNLFYQNSLYDEKLGRFFLIEC